jgi:hypothetical protein
MVTDVILRAFVLLMLGSMAASAAATDGPAQASKSIGFALVTWAPAFNETPGAADECPDGMQHLNKENWALQFPTAEQQEEETKHYVQLGPDTPGGPIPEVYKQNRGPHGENTTYNPWLVKDSLPLREVQSKIAYGLNLDGTADGHATLNTCAHQKFVSPAGEPAVDNQLYRVIGCWPGWRKSGFNVSFHKGQFVEHLLNRILIEVTGVDDEQNDDHVVVTIYKGIDQLTFDGASKPVPWLTQRIDTRFPQYITKASGRIVNGVLETEPTDTRLPLYQMNAEAERLFRGMRLKLNLTTGAAEGLLTGYEDVNEWWRGIRNSYVEVVDTDGLWSPPSTYEGVHRLADGYPDPKSGQCTAISSVYKITAVRAFVVEPPKNDPLLNDPVTTLAKERGIAVR